MAFVTKRYSVIVVEQDSDEITNILNLQQKDLLWYLDTSTSTASYWFQLKKMYIPIPLVI